MVKTAVFCASSPSLPDPLNQQPFSSCSFNLRLMRCSSPPPPRSSRSPQPNYALTCIFYVTKQNFSLFNHEPVFNPYRDWKNTDYSFAPTLTRPPLLSISTIPSPLGPFITIQSQIFSLFQPQPHNPFTD